MLLGFRGGTRSCGDRGGLEGGDSRVGEAAVGLHDPEVELRRRSLDGIARGSVAGDPLLQLCDHVVTLHGRILTDMKVLVAGVGNVLRGDDGFGVEVVR